MVRSERIALFIVTLLLLLLLSVIMIRANADSDAARVYRISYITDDAQGDHSQNIRKGLDRAARDYNVDLQIIALQPGMTDQQQADLLMREIEAGADALLFSLPQSPALAEQPVFAGASVPIVSIGSVWDSPAIACSVSSDHAAMGRMLAEEMLAQGVAACYVRTSLGSARIHERLRGFKAVMNDAGVHCSLDEDASAAAWLDVPDGAAVAALDEVALGKLAESPLAGRVSLYGIGCSNELLYHMEDGRIQRLIVEDGYAMGYLAVRSAVESIEARDTVRERILTSYVADAGSLYEEPLQHVLFPIS